MQRRRVALAADPGFGGHEDWSLLVEALAGSGLEPSVVVWNDPEVDWGSFDLVLACCMWGYVAWRPRFLAWADRVGRVTTLANRGDVLAWNSEKTYLADLAAEGVPIVPTQFVVPGGEWHPPGGELVVKPTVASGGRGAARYRAEEIGVARAHVARLHAAGHTVMVQPYQAAVDTSGETALVCLGGRFSHAVRKGPLLAVGTGEVDRLWEQQVISPVVADQRERAVAEEALDAAGRLVGPVTYARVDLVPGEDGRPMVIEVELVEPALFLDQGPPDAGARFAAAVVQAIGRATG